MKKVLFILGISVAFLTACGGGNDKPADTDSTSASNKSAVAQQSNAANDTAANKIGTDNNSGSTGNKGEELMAAADCNTCHNAESKVIGPALVDIAKKYKESDVETLAKKVIAGGSGNWGTVPMTAHPDLSLDDAKEMVKYILTVK
ncbi:MAG: c-type cytochrome [Mucilaginibacter sp.]|nr:c-type cytochrome [Mucilaginibacter sp.]